MARILVGVDGSSGSMEALRWAAEEAEAVGASLDVVMAWEPLNPEAWIPHDPPGTDRLALTRHAVRRVVSDALGEHPRVPLEARAVEGAAAKVLVDESRDADLLVVGSRGHGGFAGILLGSVSLHCVTHAPCPVVVVRGGSTPRR